MASVQLPDDLHKQLEAIVAESKEFADVSAYATYILKQVVAKKQQAAGTTGNSASYSKADEDKIRERLKNLGYLD